MKNNFNYYLDQSLQDYNFHREIYLKFNGLIFKIKLNNDQLETLVKKYFIEFLTEETSFDSLIHLAESKPLNYKLNYQIQKRDPGKTKIKEEYVNFPQGRIVRKIQTGLVFLFDGENNLAAGPCLENVNQVVNFINNRFIEIMLNKNSLLLHASGIAWKNKGISIAGFSGAGKSTLALHMLKDEINFISNDRILSKEENSGLKMYGVAKYPRINPGTIISIKAIESIIPPEERKKYHLLDKKKLWNLEEKYDLFVNEIYGPNRFKLEADMKALVILNWQHLPEKTVIKKINPSERYDLFPAFMKSPGLFYFTHNLEDLDLSKAMYEASLKNCSVYEVTGGVNFEATADYFINWLKNS